MKRIALIILLALLLPSISYAWLGDYVKRQTIPITAGSASATSVNVICQADALIKEAESTTNFGSETYLMVNTEQGETNNTARSVLSYDLSGFNSADIDTATAYWYYTGYFMFYNPVGRQVDVWKCTQDFVEGEATWIIYKTGSNWTSAGGDYDSDGTPAGGTFTIPSGVGWVSCDITALVIDAIDNHNGQLNILLKYNNEVHSNFYIPFFSSKEAASNKPYIDIDYSPEIDDNYKITVDVYRDEPTVESGTWTVNSKTYNYRVPFTIQTYTAISSVYAYETLVDTASLVAYGMFADFTATNARSVEIADSTGSNALKYWVQSAQGSVQFFNTANTRYWIGLNSLSADTEYTYYLYVDPDITAESSNHSASDVFTYFEDFDTVSADLSAFLTNYTDWESCTADLATVVTTEGILTVGGGSAATWEGIRVKSTSYNAEDFRFYARIAETIGDDCLIGMMDQYALDATTNGVAVYTDSSSRKWASWKDAVITTGATIISSGAYVAYLSMFDTDWKMAATKSFTNNTTPDQIFKNATLDAVEDVAMQITIGSCETNDIDIDWIASAPEIEKPPLVKFPDITYPHNGALFLNGFCQNWPYDVAFSLSNDTELYYVRDDIAELMKRSNRSMRTTVRMAENIGSNRNILCYYGDNSITSDHAHMSASNTYQDDIDYYSSLASSTGITEISGTWSILDTPEAIITKGEVLNNMGTGGGYLMGRFPCVAKWDTNDYRMLFCSTPWSYQSKWPTLYNTYYTSSTALDDGWDVSTYFNDSPEMIEYASGSWPDKLKVWNSVAYEFEYTLKGLEVHSSSDFSTWTTNANGPFFGPGWVETHSDGDLPNAHHALSMAIEEKDGTYYIALLSLWSEAWGDGGNSYAAFYSTTDAPSAWTSTSFTYLYASDLGNGAYIEDGDLFYDTDSTTWYFYHYQTGSPSIKYNTVSAANFAAGSWSASSNLSYSTLPPFYVVSDMTSPRIIKDGTDYWLFWSGCNTQNISYPQTYWQPNYIVSAKASSPAGPWAIQKTDTKYYQSDTGATIRSAYTSQGFVDGEIVAVVQARGSGGMLFRYNPVLQTGYGAIVQYNSSNHTSKIGLYNVSSSAYTAIGDEYTIPQYPTPQYSPGYKIKIRVRAYGDDITVQYSLWGNDWVTAVDTTDTTYGAGKIGFTTKSGAGWFNDLMVTQYIDGEPVVGAGQEATNPALIRRHMHHYNMLGSQ